jgi:hypothetical protein
MEEVFTFTAVNAVKIHNILIISSYKFAFIHFY